MIVGGELVSRGIIGMLDGESDPHTSFHSFKPTLHYVAIADSRMLQRLTTPASISSVPQSYYSRTS